ncbi:MAG: thiosulfate oxidation carrier complex protein SoxZ [Rhodobacteraceae bacterium]|nr:thiosulfate oxidation carrier complex protein SoxZ [Paracoccaceae bacterium]MCY4196534.1 thiosulfate oxidation carrier complex protein SoxZ [Paracoccaceae bacterium]MCY4326369.1 thiosulfate oxidation carrier complex protein SoxZ [Paracoccaceae bacterium]
MAIGVKPRVKIPKTAKAGDTITVKTLITHNMESGHRRGDDGQRIPRSIINRLIVDFNGMNVIDVALEPFISANPYFQFDAIVPESGEFHFRWFDDDGSIYETSKSISVS